MLEKYLKIFKHSIEIVFDALMEAAEEIENFIEGLEDDSK